MENIFNQNHFIEYCSENKLRRVISYLDENNKAISQNNIQHKCLEDGESMLDITFYFNYFEHMKKDSIDIVYSSGQNDTCNLYRVYPQVGNKKACGGCNFKKDIRSYLFSENYYDIDICNAHPNIIYSITKSKIL